MASKEDVRRAVYALRQLGCAVVILTPEDLQGVWPVDLEGHLYFMAYTFIGDRRPNEDAAMARSKLDAAYVDACEATENERTGT